MITVLERSIGAMDKITINDEQLLQESRKRIAADLAAAVKQSAKTGA